MSITHRSHRLSLTALLAFAGFALSAAALLGCGGVEQADLPNLSNLPSLAPSSGTRMGTRLAEELTVFKARELNDDPAPKGLDRSSSYLFYLPEGGSDALQYDACRDQYDAAADARMDRIFNVLRYGARGSGVSSPIGVAGVSSRQCPHCSAAVGNGGIQALADILTTTRSYTLKSGEDPSVTRPYTMPLGLQESDEWDWVGVQSALTAAKNAGGGTVLIPDTGHDYLLNRALWIGTNTRLVWRTRTGSSTHSRLVLTGPTDMGAFITNINPYDLRMYAGIADANDIKRIIAKQAGHFACKIRIHDPRIRAEIGENGISFAKGAYGIQVFGGQIEKSTWGTIEDFKRGYNEQGGRAFQFESGVQQVYVQDTKLKDSTMGVSVSAGLYSASRNTDLIYLNAADRIHLRGLTIESTELPFFLAHNLGQSLHAEQRTALLAKAPQSVLIENFTVHDSGLLLVRPKWIYPDQPLGYQAGVINLLGATNVTVRGAEGGLNRVTNSREIGSLIRGFGSKIDISTILMIGKTQALVDHHSPFGKMAGAPLVSHFRVVNLKHFGGVKSLVRMHSPMHLNSANQPYYRCLVEDSEYTTLRVQRGSEDLFGEYADQFKPADLSPPNVTLGQIIF